MKAFEEFIEEGVVKTITPDKQRAEYLIIESERKLKQLEKTITKQGIDDENANDYVEYCYNIIMFLIRANMLQEGYTSSGQGAHEAEVSFTIQLGISEADAKTLDKLRYFRNGILYHGKRFDKEYAEKVIMFTKRLNEELKKRE